MLKLTKIIIALLLLVSANFAQSPFLILMADETVADPYGEELATNGTFTTASDWTLEAGWSITGGELVGASANSNAYQVADLTTGTTYRVVYTVTFTGASSIRIAVGGTYSDFVHQWVDGSGTYEYNLVCGVGTEITINGANNFTGSIDNVSVKEVLNP